MKKLKYIFWLTLAALLGVLVHQNYEYFSSKYSLQLNLIIFKGNTPNLTNGAIIAIFVGISVLIMMMLYFVSRYDGYRAKKTIKALQKGIDESAATISQLNHDIEMLKGVGNVPSAPEMSENETNPQDGIVNEPEAENIPTAQR